MERRSFYNAILTEHNLHPYHKEPLVEVDLEREGINPSCGDDILLQIRFDGDTIADGGFTGDGCAISQASTDIMLEMVIGRTREEALHLIELFLRMITGKITDEELEELEEAGALQDISHMPSRVKCAVLSWHTLEEILRGRSVRPL